MHAMSGMEFNKIFAAILVAAVTACLTGFIASQLIHPKALHEDAVSIEGIASAGGGSGAAALPEPIMALIADADIAKGEKLVRACAACHTFSKGGADGTGPHLWNVMTRGFAKASFAYSKGMSEHGGQWSYAELNKFLWKPKSLVSDTKMNFIGVKKPEDRAAVIAYLRTLNDSAPALPSAAEIAAEQAELGPKEEAAPAEVAAEVEAAVDAGTAE
jgi:cytochrome c